MHQAPTDIVIFGVTGDLAQKKILPSLFRLFQKNLLPPHARIIGFGRREFSVESFQAFVATTLPHDADVKGFLSLCNYAHGLFDDASAYNNLQKRLRAYWEVNQVCAHTLFYLATPPQFYKTIFEHLKSSGLSVPCVMPGQSPWVRILVEKPFGKDAHSARELDDLLGTLFTEDQIYRIDHYLAKETVQNILAFRFANPLFSHIWNRNFIDHVSVSFLEAQTIGSRGVFYDGVGALRDVGQNHVLQMAALLLMDAPATLDGPAVRASRAQVFGALARHTPVEIAASSFRGQYEGYRTEQHVLPKSDTETYFALHTHLTSGACAGVPLFLEAGKGMDSSVVEMRVTFKKPATKLFSASTATELVYRVQPNEHISFGLFVKKPGHAMELVPAEFFFDYASTTSGHDVLHPYEKLLVDAFFGNQTLFVSTQEISASWGFIDPIVRAWEGNSVPLTPYTVGHTRALRQSVRACGTLPT